MMTFLPIMSAVVPFAVCLVMGLGEGAVTAATKDDGFGAAQQRSDRQRERQGVARGVMSGGARGVRVDVVGHQEGHEHEPGPMRRRHQERPDGERDGAGPHADADAMAPPIEMVVDGPGDQREAADDPQRPLVDGQIERHDDDGDGADRERVAHRDRDQRLEHRGPPVPVQSEGHREQPAHGGIQPVKGAEPHQGQPRPSRHRSMSRLLAPHG